MTWRSALIDFPNQLVKIQWVIGGLETLILDIAQRTYSLPGQFLLSRAIGYWTFIRGRGLSLAYNDRVQSADGFVKFGNFQVRIDVECQVDVAMAGQGLGHLRHDPGTG